jgi:hypothetical protein
MPDRDTKSWVALQEWLPPKECKGLIGFIRTLPLVRHLRWLIYFLQYYGWWIDTDFGGGVFFHHYEDMRFLVDVWRGNR